jgi:hypothetical protein
VVVFERRGGAAADPIENVGIRAVEERLVAVELSFVKAGQIGVRKATEDQVALACATVPGAEQQALMANFG